MLAIVDGGGGGVFEAGRTPVVCGIASCALLKKMSAVKIILR